MDIDSLDGLYSPRLIALIRAALAYPETTLEAPWDFPLVKVRGKIFCMFDEQNDGLHFTCKLRESHPAAMDRGDIEPTSHGLGKAGWITLRASHGESIDAAMLHQWMEESFRLIAPKRLVKDWETR